MRVPSDISLEAWINELIRTNKLYLFYKTPEWLSLRAEIMDDHHHECVKCAELGAWERVGGKWTRSDRSYLRRAETVHHEIEVKDNPSLALTRYLIDADGTRREILRPICMLCHNEEHGRLFLGNTPKPPLTDERW